MTEHRSTGFQRNTDLEQLLKELNEDLQLSERHLIRSSLNKEMAYPLIMVMGPLRSGTTLFTQWLANNGYVAYPTNLLSRFYKAPILGAKIQLLLTDPEYSFRDELGEFAQQVEYRSENGKTRGALAPNEFWYFWRRFLPDPQRDVWRDEELAESMDVETMRAELIGMINVFKKPFAAKGMLFNYNIPFLDSVLKNILFVQIKRDPVNNVASVLEARKRQTGNQDNWYSFKIPEYEQIKEMEAVDQVAAQIHYINSAVDAGISKVDETRKMIVQYEKFCENPAEYHEALSNKIECLECVEYAGAERFDVSKPKFDTSEIKKAVKKFG